MLLFKVPSLIMACATSTAPQVLEWVKLFPRQVTETYTSSVTFMKQLTVVAVSTITYLKELFPNENYVIDSLGGVPVTTLKKDCIDGLAQFVSTALTQAFDAFDKKYLQQLALCFYDGECHADNLMEYHIFEYTYSSDGVRLEFRSKGRGGTERANCYSFDAVRTQTVSLLRSCVVMMQTFQYEPSSAFNISLRLYYNDTAPEGYQAPGFLCPPEAEDHLAPTLGAAHKYGLVQTPFHRLEAISYAKDAATGASHEANASQNVPVMTQYESDNFCNSSVRSSQMPRVCCACNMTGGEDDTLVLIVCEYCGTAQHAVCYGVVCDRAARVARHCCTSCAHAAPARRATCARLAALPPRKREAMCIFRRTLSWCARGTVSAAALAQRFALSRSVAAKIMKQLQSDGILDQEDEHDYISPQKINMEKLNIAMSKYFQIVESSVVDRLVAEETLSQENRPDSDPVGAVLKPLEKASLQAATTIGKIVEHTPPDTVAQDFTLKQYREAILSSDKQSEELPLSGSHNPVKDMETIGKKVLERKRKIGREQPRRCGAKSRKVAKLDD